MNIQETFHKISTFEGKGRGMQIFIVEKHENFQHDHIPICLEGNRNALHAEKSTFYSC